MWQGLRELHVWSSAWSSKLLSGRLDAFFSLTLCHALITCILFAGTVSFYAPWATSFYHLVSRTAFVYWLVLLFILTLLTTNIQLVMRMVHVGSRELLQRCRRVGVMLANQQSVADYGRRRTSKNLAYNNSSSNASWSEGLRRRTHSHEQNNDNNNNNINNNNILDNDNSISSINDGVAVASTEVLLSDAAFWSLQNRTQQIRSSSIVHRELSNWLYRGYELAAGLSNTTAEKFSIFSECFNDFISPTSHDKKTSKLERSLPPLPSLSSLTAASTYDVGDAEVDCTILSEFCGSCCHSGTIPGVASRLNANNNNDKKDSSSLVSVTVQSQHHHHDINVSSNAGYDDENFSSNAGSQNMPRDSRRSSAEGRRSSAERPSRRSSGINEMINLLRGSSTGQSGVAQRRSSTEQRRSSAAQRQSGIEDRRSSAAPRDHSIPDRRMSEEARRSSALAANDVEPRRSSMGQSVSEDPRRSSAAPRQSGMEPRRSSMGQSVSEDPRRSSAAPRQSGMEPRRSSMGQSVSEDPRRSSAAPRQSGMEPRRSSAMRSSSREMSIADQRSSTGQSLSQEPRRSSAAGRQSGMEPRRSSMGQSVSQEPRQSSAGQRQSGVEPRPSAGRSSSQGITIGIRQSSAGQSINIGPSDEARRSSASAADDLEPRRSSTGQSVSEDPRRSSAAGRQSGMEPRRSSTGQSISEDPRRSSAAERPSDMEVRRSSARRSSSREMSIDGRRSSAGQSLSEDARRSSAFTAGDDFERRRSSVGQGVNRRYSRGLEVSEEAARRSVAAGAVDSRTLRSTGELTSPSMRGLLSTGQLTSASADYLDSVKPCCEPVPLSPCSSCCRPGVRPRTCWCRCANEIHDPALLDDCCGSRDGRFLSLPGFPRNKATCNSCFTPCKPLLPICSKTPDCEPRCRFSSYRPSGCSCPCKEQKDASDCKDDEDAGGGSILNRLGISHSENTSTRCCTAGSQPSRASSFKSLFTGRSSTGNVSRNNPAFGLDPSRYSSPLPTSHRSFTHTAVDNTSANSSAAFHIYWNSFWDQIAPRRLDAVHFPSTFGDVSLSELKTFTGHLVETVIARLKAQYAEPEGKLGTKGSSPPGTTDDAIQEEDLEAMFGDILREMMRSTDQSSSRTSTKSQSGDDSAASLRDEDKSSNEDDDNLQSEPPLDDASLREFAGSVVERLYTTMQHKLLDAENDGNYNCSNLVASADNEIRSHVCLLYTCIRLYTYCVFYNNLPNYNHII